MKQKLLKDRYLQPNEKDERDVYERVSKFIGREDKEYTRQLYESMVNGIWLPNSPTLANAGVQGSGGLSACYVLPVEDSLDGIYRTVWHAARVHKYFGGTGFNFSRLRQRGALIQSTKGKACGPVKVMELLNESAGVVSQGGKREGANMGILNADHPDIQEFISCKDRGSGLTHFNISVGLTDENMRSGDELVHTIAGHAWRTGDPGVIFLDRLNEGNKHPEWGAIDCTNPCGEQPLRPYESCNLASINLGALAAGDFDFGMLSDAVTLSVRALNDIIDLNSFPIPEIEAATKRSRKIGSGVMGWADTLIKMGLEYQSTEALHLIDDIGDRYYSVATSYTYGNETVMTIAPTGTLSFLANCSSGIEPVYDWVYTRESEAGTVRIEHPLKELAKHNGLEKDIAKNISPEWQIKHVAQWQYWVDNAVSKTINLPANATVQDIEDAIHLAWKLKCKGITVYRDGSKDKQVLKSVEPSHSKRKSHSGVERFGSTLDFPTGCGKIHITTNSIDRDNKHPWEVYILTQGGCPALNEALGKVISKYLHDPRLVDDERVTCEYIVGTLSKVVCPTAVRNPKSAGKSCADIIAKRIRAYWLSDNKKEEVSDRQVCPQCGNPVTFGSGCRNGTCMSCGWSGCS